MCLHARGIIAEGFSSYDWLLQISSELGDHSSWMKKGNAYVLSVNTSVSGRKWLRSLFPWHAVSALQSHLQAWRMYYSRLTGFTVCLCTIPFGQKTFVSMWTWTQCELFCCHWLLVLRPASMKPSIIGQDGPAPALFFTNDPLKALNKVYLPSATPESDDTTGRKSKWATLITFLAFYCICEIGRDWGDSTWMLEVVQRRGRRVCWRSQCTVKRSVIYSASPQLGLNHSLWESNRPFHCSLDCVHTFWLFAFIIIPAELNTAWNKCQRRFHYVLLSQCSTLRLQSS